VNVRADLEKQIFTSVLIRTFFLILVWESLLISFQGFKCTLPAVYTDICVFIQIYIYMYIYLFTCIFLKLESLLCANTWTRLIWLGKGTGGGRL